MICLSKKTQILFIFHKPLNQVDGQTKYVKQLLNALEISYTIVIPSENFFKHFNTFKINWLIRTTFVNIYLMIWIFKNLNKIRRNFRMCISEDRYVLIPFFFLKVLTRIKLISRISDWGERYADSLSFNRSVDKIIIMYLDFFYRSFTLKFSSGIIVPSEYMWLEIKEIYDYPILIFLHPYSNDSDNSNDEDINLEFRDIEHDIYCVLVGNFNYKPNNDSAMFVLNELSQKIFELDNKIKIILVGVGSIERYSSYYAPNVQIIGEVSNLKSVFDKCQIGLNPSLTPGGTSIKNIDYLVNGLIVIATSEAAVGTVTTSNMIIGKRDEFPNLVAGVSNMIRGNKLKGRAEEIKRIQLYYSKELMMEKVHDFLKRF